MSVFYEKKVDYFTSKMWRKLLEHIHDSVNQAELIIEARIIAFVDSHIYFCFGVIVFLVLIQWFLLLHFLEKKKKEWKVKHVT